MEVTDAAESVDVTTVKAFEALELLLTHSAVIVTLTGGCVAASASSVDVTVAVQDIS